MLSRFDQFTEQINVHIKSSEWLCEESNKLIKQSKNLAEDASEEQIDELIRKIEYLESKIKCEDRIRDRIVDEFNDIL